MNCLEFRRKMLEDPFESNNAMQEHERECPDCGPFAVQLRQEEAEIRSALKSIQPPAELVDRILFEAKFDKKPKVSVTQRVWYSVAASIMLTVAVSIVSLMSTSLERSSVAIADSVIKHIEDEEHHLHETGRTSKAELKYLFSRFNAKMVIPIEKVGFAYECPMHKHSGVHLVIDGELGPITVFFMPKEYAKSRTEINTEGYQGHVLPTEWGSIALVGQHGEDLTNVSQKMVNSVHWPTNVASFETHQRSSNAGIHKG